MTTTFKTLYLDGFPGFYGGSWAHNLRTGWYYRYSDERTKRNGPEMVENEEKQEEIRQGLNTHDFGVESDGIGQLSVFQAAPRHNFII